MDETCRACMVQWTNNLVDFCHYDRETADIAISCLDRFLSSPEGSQTLLHTQQFQLAAMTAFYTAAKIHERQAMEPASIARLSRGAHSKEAVEQMELFMLKVLRWKVHPPTAIRFAQYFLDLIPSEIVDEKHRTVIMELVRYQLNVALSEYRLSLQRSSHLGLAVMMNALEDQELLDEFTAIQIQSKIGTLLPGYHDEAIWDIQLALSVAVSSRPGTTVGITPCSTTDHTVVVSNRDGHDGLKRLGDGSGSPTVVVLSAEIK
jgi:hypothetical protein